MRAFFTCVCAAAVFGAGLTSSAKGAIMVESRTGGENFAAYLEDGGGFPNSWASSSAKSTAPGVTAGIGSRFNSTAGIGGAGTWFQVSPILDVAGGQYYIDVTTTGASGDIVATSTVTVTNGVLTGTDVDGGLAGFQTDAFGAPHNVWNRVGTLTLNAGQTTPSVRFEETSHNNRFYADAVRFTLVPEPASLGLLALSALGLIRRRHA